MGLASTMDSCAPCLRYARARFPCLSERKGIWNERGKAASGEMAAYSAVQTFTDDGPQEAMYWPFGDQTRLST